MAEQIQKAMPVFMLSTRDSLQIQGHIQAESERVEKDSMEIKIKRKLEQQHSYQINRFYTKDYYKQCYRRQGRILKMIKGSKKEDIVIEKYM